MDDKEGKVWMECRLMAKTHTPVAQLKQPNKKKTTTNRKTDAYAIKPEGLTSVI